ncbi:MAG: type II secretion system F family protein, partial [Thiotrichales bacterium]|nr:type II secretion system F family protein [Thiotrichales bacterium]
VGLVFMTVACLSFGLMLKGQEFMGGYKETFTESTDATMADMFMFVDATRLFYMNIMAMFIIPAFIYLLTGDWITTVAVFALFAFLPGIVYRSMRKKRLRKFEEQLPDGLLMLSGAMRAGASLNIALEGLVKEQPAPISQEFELFTREQRIGTDFDISLTNMEKRLPLQDFSMFSSALRINREIGGNLAEILESLGETIRRKHQMEGKIESLTAQGKMQGIVMTGLPLLLACILYFIEPEAMAMLWETPIGWGTLFVIFVMEVLGYTMIKKITSIDV